MHLAFAIASCTTSCSKPTTILALEAIDDENMAVALADGDACRIGVVDGEGDWRWQNEEPDCKQVEMRATARSVGYRISRVPEDARLVVATIDGTCNVDLRDRRLRWVSPWSTTMWGDRRIDVLGDARELVITGFTECAPLAPIEVPADTGSSIVEAGYLALETPEGDLEIRPADGGPSYRIPRATASAYGPTALIYREPQGPWIFHDIGSRRDVDIDLNRNAVGAIRVVWQLSDSLVLFIENGGGTTLARVNASDGKVLMQTSVLGIASGFRRDTPKWLTTTTTIGLLWQSTDSGGVDSIVRFDTNLAARASKIGVARLFVQIGSVPIAWSVDGRLHVMPIDAPTRSFTTLPVPQDTDALIASRTTPARTVWWLRGADLHRVDIRSGEVESVTSF